MVEIEQTEAITALGFAGCVHGKKNGNRQVLLVDQETLEAMDLQPGVIRENITTQGLNVNGLVIGEQLRIGEVLLQVSAVCSPCDQLELARPGLRREMYGRRGMLCRVVEGGAIRSGDSVVRVVAAATG
jgi:MOSC domain-containing protein YiiM